MNLFRKLPGYAPLAAASCGAVLLAVLVTLFAAGTSRDRGADDAATEALSRAAASATAISSTGGPSFTTVDQFATAVADATGMDVIVVDTTTIQEPSVLGSSLADGSGLANIARRNRFDPEDTELFAIDTLSGREYYVGTSFVAGGPGGDASVVVALLPTDADWLAPGIPWTTGLIMILLGAGVVIGMTAWSAGRMALPLRQVTLAAERAADGELIGVPLRPEASPVGDLAKGVTRVVAAMQEQRKEIAELKKRPTAPDPTVEAEATKTTETEKKVKVDGANLTPGQVFEERYEILQRLGSSAVRTAYKVRDRELDDEVTLKTLQENIFGGDTQSVEQFRSDLRVARRLAHPNILRVDDFGVWGGVYYVTMDFIEATPLRALIRDRKDLPVERAVEIMRQVCTGLSIAHADGVVHRDLRPESILIDSKGTAKLADFGLASPAHRTRASASSDEDAYAKAYVAPEILRAEGFDERSDLYGLGVSLYETLTGELPFPDGQRADGEATPDVREKNAEVSEELAGLVAALLSDRPADRPESADAVKAALEKAA